MQRRKRKTKEKSGYAAATTPKAKDDGAYITVLNSNDVLCGRGLGQSQYIGNRRFRQLINERKQDYLSTKSHTIKGEISLEIYNEVTRRGGRFLRLVESKPTRDVVESGKWQAVDFETSNEKCKQSLREKSPCYDPNLTEEEKYKPEDESNHSLGGNGLENDFSSVAADVVPSAFDDLFSFDCSNESQETHALMQSAGLSPVPPPRVMEDSIDTRLLLFQSLDSAIGGDVVPQSSPEEPISVADGDHCPLSSATDIPGNASQKDTELAEASESVLEMLGLGSQLPHYTEQDEQRELAAMTNEERDSVLSDTFGKKCTIDGHRKEKKPRRDLDGESLAFLLRQMKLEIDRIPENSKLALVEAKQKCNADEFSDDRLEIFLQSEGMNATLAARRFITYWECRRDLFGPDKYTLPMTLSGAMKDETAALNAGAVSILPNRDSSGRRILLIGHHRRPRTGYSSESLLRLFWFLVEIIVREPGYDGWGFVALVDEQGASIFDFESRVDSKVAYYMNDVWPARAIPMHSCCPTGFFVKAVKPITFMWMNRIVRARFVIHEVPENELLSSLSPYGITSEMLPMEMGGTLVLNQREWIASRRANEMARDEVS